MTSIAVNKWKAVTDARHSHYRCNCNLVRVIHIDAMFEYLGKIRHLRSHKDICGFGCQIDSNQAMQWVKENRPHLYIEE